MSWMLETMGGRPPERPADLVARYVAERNKAYLRVNALEAENARLRFDLAIAHGNLSAALMENLKLRGVRLVVVEATPQPTQGEKQ